MMNNADDNCPDTMPSAGIAPKAPKPAPVRRLARATYQVISRGLAFVEVAYLGAPDLFSMMRVEIRNPDIDVNGVDPLYEESYRQASIAASIHGYELDRFARA